ncbi:MAG TPA: sigma-54 dependent transcriptional regulator [Methylomirabilota bacterium]|nr:sigma-54 dependent transcriptional regulator [Methylomirabilota bacterium]
MTLAHSRLRPLSIVIDDDPQSGRALGDILRRFGHEAERYVKGAEALDRVREAGPEVVFLDSCLPGQDGLALLEGIRDASARTAVIVMSADRDDGTVVDAMKRGASDFLSRPFTADDVRAALDNVLEKARLQREVERLREQVARARLELRGSGHGGLFAHSPRMRAIKEMVDQVADTDATVLVWGESGVGKELVARAIHDSSPRRERAFTKVNCAALPAELLESELFGYERGAFTGAHRAKPGRFDLAHGGTIFLDEIGEIPVHLQAKLLQVLQDCEFARLGGGQNIRVDVRVVASTNRDLERAVTEGSFRADLYYRLNVVNVHVPPLRERREEIPILAEDFWQRYSRQYNRQGPRLSPGLVARFQAHSWPGNVRQLENLVKRIVVLENEDFVTHELLARAEHVPGADAGIGGEPPVTAPVVDAADDIVPPGVLELGLKEIARRAAHEAERAMIRQVLDEVGGSRLVAARRLQVSYKALSYKIALYGLAGPGRAKAPQEGGVKGG